MYVPSPHSDGLGILRLADRFKSLPSRAFRYGPEPRLKLLRLHLAMDALLSLPDGGFPVSFKLLGGSPSFVADGVHTPSVGYEYRMTTAQEDFHSYVKRPTGRDLNVKKTAQVI